MLRFINQTLSSFAESFIEIHPKIKEIWTVICQNLKFSPKFGKLSFSPHFHPCIQCSISTHPQHNVIHWHLLPMFNSILSLFRNSAMAGHRCHRGHIILVCPLSSTILHLSTSFGFNKNHSRAWLNARTRSLWKCMENITFKTKKD